MATIFVLFDVPDMAVEIKNNKKQIVNELILYFKLLSRESMVLDAGHHGTYIWTREW